MSLTQKRTCSVSGCHKKCIAKGICSMHYWRLTQRGDVNYNTYKTIRKATFDGDTAILPLGINAKDGTTLVDKLVCINKRLDDHNYWLSSTGYAMTDIDGKRVRLHHLVIGKPDDGLVVDHINRNKLDNRVANLRFVNRAVNALNKGNRSDNKSGMRGVSWSSQRNRWRVRLSLNYKEHHIGFYVRYEDAVQARISAEDRVLCQTT